MVKFWLYPPSASYLDTSQVYVPPSLSEVILTARTLLLTTFLPTYLGHSHGPSGLVQLYLICLCGIPLTLHTNTRAVPSGSEAGED